MAIALSAAIGLFTCSAYGQDDPKDAADITSKKILAIFHPLKTATLSAEVLSVVKKVRHEMGEKFKKNDILIDLDATLYVAAKKKADATLVSADAANRTNRKLYAQKSVSEIEFSRAKADLEIAKASVAIAKRELAACSVRAPYCGRVVKLLVNENELVQPGQPLIEILDDGTMRAKFMAPSVFYNHIQMGQTLSVRVRRIDRDFKCKITHISPILESNTSTFQVFGEIDNPEGVLRGGMTGQVMLEAASDSLAENKPETPPHKISASDKERICLEDKKNHGQNDLDVHYTLHLSSYNNLKKVRKELVRHREKGLNPYAIKVDLGKKGVWWGIYIGHYKTRAEAVKAKEALRLADSIVKEKSFASLVGSYATESAMQDMSRKLEELGYFAYAIKGKKDTFRLLTGAFYSRKRAEKLNADLQSHGIEAQVIRISEASDVRLPSQGPEVLPRGSASQSGKESLRSKRASINPARPGGLPKGK